MALWNPAAERIFGWSREEILGPGGSAWSEPPQKLRTGQRAELRAQWLGRRDEPRNWQSRARLAVTTPSRAALSARSASRSPPARGDACRA
jgi:PAS domain-containing protein